MQIIHGDNTVASRAQLVGLLDQARAQQREIVRAEAKRLDIASLQDLVGSSGLFGQPKTIVIEELHSLPKSKKKDALLDSVVQLNSQLDESTHLILWEKRPLTATMLKRFGSVSATEHKVSSALFKWLETISPQPQTKAQQLTLFHQALKNDDPFMCMAMLIRQVRLLIQAKDGGPLKGAPFMIAKLKKQAQAFTLEQLLKVHARLLEIDLAEKTSSDLLSLEQKLDLLIVEL
jgi:DNA polymerase III delta subunit